MDLSSVLLGSNAFWVGIVIGLAGTLLIVALVLALMAWYDSRFPLDEAPQRPAPVAAGTKRAQPNPEASPVHVWPRRRGAEL